MHRVISLYFTGQFGKFLVAGRSAALANFASRFAFEPGARLLKRRRRGLWRGLITAFSLKKAFVFPVSGRPPREEMSWCFLFNALAFPIVVGASVILNAYVSADGCPKISAKPARTEPPSCASASISPRISSSRFEIIEVRRGIDPPVFGDPAHSDQCQIGPAEAIPSVRLIHKAVALPFMTMR